MKKKTTIKIISAAALLILAVSLVVGYLVAEHKILYHFAVVDPGKVYRSGTLSELGLKWAHARSGFKTIVNVRSKTENQDPWHGKQAEFIKANGLKMVNIPLETDTPPSPEQIRDFLEIVSDPANLPVLIHCHQGVTRTAMIVAVYEIAVQKKTNREVLAEMPLFGHSFNQKDKDEVRNFILQYNPETDPEK